MVNRLLKLNHEMTKFEKKWVFYLSVLLVSLILSNFLEEKIDTMSVYVVTFLEWSQQTAIQFWVWVYKMFGLMIFPLTLVTVACFFAVFSLKKVLKRSYKDVIVRAEKKFGSEFKELWQGRHTFDFKSQADERLCNMISYFCCNNRIMVNNVYKKSKLYNPATWNFCLANGYGIRALGRQLTYGDLRIHMAMRNCRDEKDSYLKWLYDGRSLGSLLGCLGTVLALMNTMSGMGTVVDNQMLDYLIKNSSGAFGSTFYGGIIVIGAYYAIQYFEKIFQSSEARDISYKIDLLLSAPKEYGNKYFLGTNTATEGVRDEQQF